ncbi:MAG TPA: cyclic pyranopterin monophosphate synthase MoaC [Candidatus Polarisedimenticolaceae bacterium]|nr:cyclic pyranopterin monophosphate synthase MoaC [Candidatus Polarisedimenticolaceae bacterium]
MARRRKLTHADDSGAAVMVDVGGKSATKRRAVARATVALGPVAFKSVREHALAKGDALAVARLAGIQAGKRTAEWIPLCHTVPLDRLDVAIELSARDRRAVITATAEARWATGVEMEALVAASAAALALYDMTKGVDRAIEIERIALLEKSGGRSGTWRRKAGRL